MAIRVVALLVSFAALASCATPGKPYPEHMAEAGPVPDGQARIVLLRPDKRGPSKAYVRIDEKLLGKLAIEGFLLADVHAGAVEISASGKSKMYGVCRLPLEVAAGETLYVELAPRPENVVADVVGSLAGLAVPGADSVAQSVGAMAVGAAAASAAESAGKLCGGPFRLTRIPETTALSALETLTVSK